MSIAKKIKVLLAEDHTIVRQGLCSLMKADGGFQVVGEARTGREAVAMAQALRPDVILMDISMPVLNGLEATRQVLKANPAARVVILSAHTDDVYVERMKETGAAGYIEKQTSGEILTQAIRAVVSGCVFYSPAIAKRLHEDRRNRPGRVDQVQVHAVRLTSREAEVLQLVAEGLANKQVAAALGISIKTVEKHRQYLMDKLNIHDTAGLTRYAIATGVIEGRVQVTG